jgi:methyl-accepting chemotaxis protein
MKNISIGGRLFIGFGIVLFLLVIASTVGITALTKSEDNLAYVQDVNKSVTSASNLVIAITSITDTTKSIALSDKPEDKQRLFDKIGELRKAYKSELELLAKTTKTAEGKQLLANLQEGVMAGKATSGKLIDLGMRGDKAGFMQL